jgi:Spy/CpxP family protein refolding chaperone
MFCKLLLTGILATTLALAQRGGGGGGGGGDMGDMGGGGGGGRGGGMDLPSVGPSRPSRLDQLTQSLKLTKDQKKEVKSLMDEAQKEAAPVREQLMKSRLAIGEAIQGPSGEEDIKRLVSKEAAIQSQMAGIELNAFAKIYKGLDKEQQANTRSVFQMMKGIFNGKNWNTEE